MNKQYSNGKLLLTAEYLVLDGAKALAVPTKFGQDMTVQPICEPIIAWKSYDVDGNCWFSSEFEPNTLKIISATFSASKDGGNDTLAETLHHILVQAHKLNPRFLNNNEQLLIETHLGFAKNWGLGSSSTLINNIASWAQVNAFDLAKNTFGGSRYDIACAQHDTPIIYHLDNDEPKVETVNFNPSFADQLYFVHLNKKQNSRDGITQYRKNKQNIKQDITDINALTNALVQVINCKDLDKIINEHERIIGSIIKQEPVKKVLFPDYFGSVKSLGAWGGDFILVTGNDETPNYFKNKGFETILKYSEMVL